MVDASRSAIIRQVPATDGGLHVTDCLEQPPEVRVALGAQADGPVHEDQRRALHQVTAWIRPAISPGLSRLAKWPVAVSVTRRAPGIARALASRSAGCDQSSSP